MTLKGVDISSNNPLSHATLKETDFVIVKVSQGTYYVNPMCDKQYQAAKKAGKLMGIYHYAGGNDPVKEADYFLKHAAGYIHEAILCIDWEPIQNANWGSTTWVKKFVQRVYDKTGVWCLIYTGLDGIKQCKGLEGKCDLWFAGWPNGNRYDSWTPPKNFPWSLAPWKNCAIWQYTSTRETLDKNIAYISKAAWKKYANPKGTGGSTGGSKPKPPSSSSYSTKGKSLEQMAQDTQDGKTGNGAARLKALGKYATGVQAIINHRANVWSTKSVVNVLANEVIKGRYGTGAARKKLLGNYNTPVQKRVNEIL